MSFSVGILWGKYISGFGVKPLLTHTALSFFSYPVILFPFFWCKKTGLEVKNVEIHDRSEGIRTIFDTYFLIRFW